MPSDREVQAARRKALVEIMTGGQQVSDQRDLVQMLRDLGHPATQSSVSRDLKALGAVRTRGYYEIPSWTAEENAASPFRRVVPFVRRVKQAGPYLLLLITDPGAGRMVAQAIDDSKWEDLVGTVDGDSKVLLLTENFFFQRLIYERLKYYMRLEGNESAAGPEPEPELE